MTDTRPHLFDLTVEEAGDLVVSWGWTRYRGDQILHWLYHKNVVNPQHMTNLTQPQRNLLEKQVATLSGRIDQHQTASDGVEKLLIAWPVASATECVMIPADSRRTACISSQAGCPVGCRFCASGLGGLDANLTAGQMVEQVWQLQSHTRIDRITHVVFMGMGEPLANFEQVVRAVKILAADWALNLSIRHITISTVGLPAQIRRLADLKLAVTLAISLHAPNDALRRQLIPWAKSVSIRQLIEAGQYYFHQTGREVTLEYVLLRQVNDQLHHARELADVARQLRSNVNLIRYNEVSGLPFYRPHSGDVHHFQATLKHAGINTHIRASRGRDIAAACGQLRHEANSAYSKK